jgi:maltooligosyltrehalose trehalohydrolase
LRWGEGIPDPHDEATFASAKLSWQWPEGSPHAGMRRLYADLLRARRAWPALRDRRHTRAKLLDGPRRRGDGAPAAVLRIERGRGERLVALANLTAQPQRLPGRGTSGLELLLSTEQDRYGGPRRRGEPLKDLRPYELALFGNPRWEA